MGLYPFGVDDRIEGKALDESDMFEIYWYRNPYFPIYEVLIWARATFASYTTMMDSGDIKIFMKLPKVFTTKLLRENLEENLTDKRWAEDATISGLDSETFNKSLEINKTYIHEFERIKEKNDI